MIPIVQRAVFSWRGRPARPLNVREARASFKERRRPETRGPGGYPRGLIWGMHCFCTSILLPLSQPLPCQARGNSPRMEFMRVHQAACGTGLALITLAAFGQTTLAGPLTPDQLPHQ